MPTGAKRVATVCSFLVWNLASSEDSPGQACLTMRFGSTAKVLLKCKLKYYRISECVCDALPRTHPNTSHNLLQVGTIRLGRHHKVYAYQEDGVIPEKMKSNARGGRCLRRSRPETELCPNLYNACAT